MKQLRGNQTLDKVTADAIAHAVKVWAIERGASHFTHWFQPMTDSTAEKHDSFLTLKSSFYNGFEEVCLSLFHTTHRTTRIKKIAIKNKDKEEDAKRRKIILFDRLQLLRHSQVPNSCNQNQTLLLSHPVVCVVPLKLAVTQCGTLRGNKKKTEKEKESIEGVERG